MTGADLRVRRREAGIGIPRLARVAGWSPARILAIERTPDPTAQVALRYLDALRALEVERGIRIGLRGRVPPLPAGAAWE